MKCCELAIHYHDLELNCIWIPNRYKKIKSTESTFIESPIASYTSVV